MPFTMLFSKYRYSRLRDGTKTEQGDQSPSDLVGHYVSKLLLVLLGFAAGALSYRAARFTSSEVVHGQSTGYLPCELDPSLTLPCKL